MEEAISKFNINVIREVFLLAAPPHLDLLQKLIKNYYFLSVREAKELGNHRSELHFVVATLDFGSPEQMHGIARTFTALESPLAHKLIYVTAPNELTREQLLFAQEIGARYVAAGPGKNDEIKEYLKRICVDLHQVGSLAAFEAEIEAYAQAGDKEGLRRALEKLKALPAVSEESLRLLARAATHLGALKHAEGYLRRILELNPQNLWAANSLGKMYLRSGHGARGIEMLAKLSRFHELNGERLLTLGDALVQAGQTSQAEATYRQGDQLTGGTDLRFKDGLAKVKLERRDYAGALAVLGGRNFSENVISFLNMRAIMAIRGGQLDEGMEYYGYAVGGAGEDKDVKAKLKFNIGLAYARVGDLEKARAALSESCELGEGHFKRASKPLALITKVLQAQSLKRADAAQAATADLEESEWETLF